MMMGNNDKKIINQIKEGLDYMESHTPVNRPSLSQFKHLISQVEEKKRIKKNYEFLLFLLTAASTLSVSVGVYRSFAAIFIIVQTAALLLLPVGAFIWFRRYIRQVND
ncbi:MAG: YxlC family protein [Bacillota bacterium]